jgi:hypothetical protein
MASSINDAKESGSVVLLKKCLVAIDRLKGLLSDRIIHL